MTMEKLVRRNLIIAQHLSEIAVHGQQSELDGAPQSVDPLFRAVLSAQERLLTAVEQLLEKLPGRTVG